MKIFFENEFAIVVDKPAGWLTTPARDAKDPRLVLGRELQARVGAQIYPVHRLDFEVSGIVVFAKTGEAHREMQGWFERGEIRKTYVAWSSAAGSFEGNEWMEWRSRLVRGKRRTFEAAHGKESVTRARRVGGRNGVFEWELMPLTGRPHQLRFEMSKHGVPILGDKLYGGAEWKREGRIALRAVKLDVSGVTANRFGLPESLVASGLE